ncbi:hypothetical protein JTB14_037183 [Gonioctena quinquepunctata]|nr:hypothetical protein JTB14_037183 [Gonioctena quinquepunctata]
MQGLKFAHIRKFTPIHMKKFVMNIEKVYNNAMKQFHFMNCPRFAYSLMNLMKSLMKPKLASRVFLYEDASIIREIIPLEALPSDYGGPELSLYKLNELWKKKLAKYENRFDALAKMKTNEKLRPQPLTNDEVLGFHGQSVRVFQKLFVALFQRKNKRCIVFNLFSTEIGMAPPSAYFEDVPRVVEMGLKRYDRTQENLKEYTDIMKEWLKDQLHLPEIPTDNTIRSFLMMNKFSIENTKQSIDMYYTMRSLFPEFFENKHPMSTNMQRMMDVVNYVPMPKATDEGYRIIIFQFSTEDSENCNFISFMAHAYNTNEVRLNEDCHLGDIFIYDMKFVKMAHLVQITPTTLKKSTIIFQKVFNSNMKQIHFLNYPSMAEPMIMLTKQLVKPKMAERFHFHKDTNTISDFIAVELLPRDYGGKQPSLNELGVKWRKKFAEYEDRFNVLDTLRVDEKLRPTPLVNDEVLGFHGNFKKLNVD